MIKNSWERHRGPRNRTMNSYKNSEQARKMREWKQFQEIQTGRYYKGEAKYSEMYSNQEYQRYLAARRKVMWQRIHAYLIVGCAIGVIGVLMFWP